MPTLYVRKEESTALLNTKCGIKPPQSRDPSTGGPVGRDPGHPGNGNTILELTLQYCLVITTGSYYGTVAHHGGCSCIVINPLWAANGGPSQVPTCQPIQRRPQCIMILLAWLIHPRLETLHTPYRLIGWNNSVPPTQWPTLQLPPQHSFICQTPI